MKIGLTGLPMSGKTTIFNMATKSKAQTRDYLAQVDEINTGIIKVPDDRIDYLTDIFKPKKTVYATIEFTDIPGISSNDKKAATKTLAGIRTCDALLVVVRLFPDSAVGHIHDKVDPITDLEEIFLEFTCSDLDIVLNKIEKIKRDMKSGKKPELIKEMELMESLKECLENTTPLSELNLPDEDLDQLKGFRFLTLKPMLIVANCSDEQFATIDNNPLTQSFKSACQKKALTPIFISAKTEMEISTLSPEEQRMFLEEFNIAQSASSRLINASYSLLNYISFLTVGEDEVRAWPIQNGTIAQKAAGKVHSDIERGFIRAEVVAYDDFITHKSMNAVKSAGLARLEGKEYLVKDGDIINFRFNI